MLKEELLTPLMGLYQETISDLLTDTDTVNEEEEEERVDVVVTVKKLQRSHQQLLEGCVKS